MNKLKTIAIILGLLFLSLCLSSCGVLLQKDCDCPTFGNQGIIEADKAQNEC